jgi:hypothetical protein
MTDPKRRLLEGDAPERARELLRAIEVPSAPSAAKQDELVRKLATLAAASPLAPAAALGGWIKLALVCAGSAGSAALLLATLEVFSGAHDTSANEPHELHDLSAIESTQSLVAAPLPPAPAPPPPAALPPAALPPSPAPEPAAAGPAFVASHAAAASRVDSKPPVRSLHRSMGDALAAEEALLERVRGLASSAPDRAWALLEQHRRRFPTGQLVAERLSLGVDVLQRLGKTPQAQAQAQALMRQFPSSVYAVQLRQRPGLPR